MENIENYYQKRFGFNLIADAGVRRKIALAVASRNLIVHRRGIIDSRFIHAAGSGLGRIGNRVKVTHLIWEEMVPAILEVVRDVDRSAAAKFGFQSAFVVCSNDVAELQADFFESVEREVMGWRSGLVGPKLDGNSAPSSDAS